MPKKTHKLNIMLTEQQFQRLKLYAEQQEESMAEVIRNLIKKLSIKETSNID
jgi:S-adenosylmethionine:diacylglycerol 3-amino-3-carboxypropyl transferase